MIEIRRAEPSDAEAICKLHVASIKGLGPRSYPAEVVEAWCSGKDPQKYIEAMGSTELMYVACEDAEVVGFASLIIAKREVRAVYVHPDHFRKGAGRKLLERLEKVAAQQGLDSLALASSLVAVPFYKDRGYAEKEHLDHNLDGGTAIRCVWMTKKLQHGITV